MLIAVVLAAIALWALIRLGRQREPREGGGWRIAATIFAACAMGGAAVAAMRGAWLTGAGLVAVAIWLTVASRQRRPAVRNLAGMDPAEARATLGVGSQATEQEIQAAYRRLMQRVHPDLGGAEGLATRLNAARDRLLKG